MNRSSDQTSALSRYARPTGLSSTPLKAIGSQDSATALGLSVKHRLQPLKAQHSSDSALEKPKTLKLVVALPQTDIMAKRKSSLPPPPARIHPVPQSHWKHSLWPHSSVPLALKTHCSTQHKARKAGWMHGYAQTDPFLRLSLT